MIDGILDLLAAILVLGIVLAISFSFILPLTNDELMQYNSKYEDKAILNTITEYDDVDDYSKITKRIYSYEELVLLLAVQDSRMEDPKAINLRNLVTAFNLRSDTYNDSNLNELVSTDKVLQAIQYYGENNMDLVDKTFSADPNVGSLRISEDYGLKVDDICSFLTRSPLATKGKILNSEKRYYLTYQYAIPNSSPYIENKPAFKKNYNNEPVYMVQIDGNWQAGNTKVDTLTDYQAFIDTIRNTIKE